MATTAALHSLQLPFDALKLLDNMIITKGAGGDPIVTVMPCETIIVNGVCPLPCTGTDDPLCKDDPLPSPIVTDPTGPIIDPDPIIAGGGGGSGIGGVSVGSVGGVPELSTWELLVVGFGLLGMLRFKLRQRASPPLV